jgi:hypothetical protein
MRDLYWIEYYKECIIKGRPEDQSIMGAIRKLLRFFPQGILGSCFVYYIVITLYIHI